MHVESVKGKGSTFAFTSVHDIPTKDELVGFLRQSDLPSEAALVTELESFSIANTPAIEAPRFGMVCVAEDNPYVSSRKIADVMLTMASSINLRHLAKNLDVLGYKYTLCTNGQEALDKFREADSNIDAVIIDMSMPVMGKSAYNTLQQRLLSPN